MPVVSCFHNGILVQGDARLYDIRASASHSLKSVMRRLLPFILLAAHGSASGAQAPSSASDLPAQSVDLSNLSAFRPTSANWRIAGSAAAERTRALALTAEKGTGVLVNIPTTAAKGHLFTTWEHGDLDLSLDVMLPKGSNSGVYLMGRYEVQLFDSWGVREPSFADLGGIYQRWDDKRGPGREGYEGIPPRQNASRAPGLWQHLDIVFRAPKFVGTQKVANARFVKVMVNGVVVHENVEVTGPTRSAAFDDERATGPLMIQGDHGPVAVRAIQYKSYTGTVKIAGLRYHVYEGDPMDSSFIATHAPTREGDAAAISADVVSTQDKLAVKYDGSLSVPATGRFRFQLGLPWIGTDSATRGASVGGGTLTIDGKPVVVHTGADRNSYADAELAAGQHAFVLTYYKNRASSNRRDAALWVEGPGVERQALSENGAPNGDGAPNPIVVEPALEPVVLRSFINHRGTKRVIAVSVADPFGVHYSYDLAQGALLYVWRGPFLETTEMWHERGESQTAEPMGSALMLPGTPSLAFLGDAKAVWPDSIVDERELRRDGYQLDKSGHPTFLYHARGVAVEDDLRPDAAGLGLKRELRLRTSRAVAGLYVQLAQGAHIVLQRDGSYVVGDRSYYITVSRGSRAIVRHMNGRDELLVPVTFNRGEASVAYGIVW
jgi:Domain of Unknown Function (DUF1080)